MHEEKRFRTFYTENTCKKTQCKSNSRMIIQAKKFLLVINRITREFWYWRVFQSECGEGCVVKKDRQTFLTVSTQHLLQTNRYKYKLRYVVCSTIDIFENTKKCQSSASRTVNVSQLTMRYQSQKIRLHQAPIKLILKYVFLKGNLQRCY